MKFKMAATAGLSLTLEPMRKMFQNSSLKPLGQLKHNCPGIIIRRSSTKFLFFYAERKSKMAATAGHRLSIYVLRPSWISDRHKKNLVEDLPMIIPGQFGFNCPSSFREEAF
jgi:hypothetical protein